ncbi:MAG TPA: tetratricopeptide repeat protein [Candidatus Deferrimicrobium sp.]|nr:tetratricopeptide repeat protein [Candidatus Deferrimicrobium sp.]
MRPPRVALSLILSLLGCASGLLAQLPEDAAEKRLAQQRQCRAWLRSALDFRQQGKPADALLVLDSVLLCDAKNPDAYYLRSRLLIENGDTTGAITALRLGAAEAPLSTRLKLFLARLLIARSDFSEAASLVDAVLRIKPHEGEALYLRGVLDLKSGNEAAALDHLELALKYGLESHAR